MIGAVPSRSPIPGRSMAESDVTRVIGLQPVWITPLTRHLRFPTPAVVTSEGERWWDLPDVRGWLQWYDLTTAAADLPVRHLRWLVERVVVRRSVESLQEPDARKNRIERAVVAAAVHLVRRIPYEVQRDWANSRSTGRSELRIATDAQVGVTLVRLALDGIPKPRTGGRINPYHLKQLWEQGLTVPDIAHQLGRSPGRTQREIYDAGDWLMPRLTSKQIADRYGWTRTNVRGLRPTGRFPPPDNPSTLTNGKGAWWWATTLEQWETETNLQNCPVCGGRFQRLSTHQKHRHEET